MIDIQQTIARKMNEILSEYPCPEHGQVPVAEISEGRLQIKACCQTHTENSALRVGAKPPAE